jgi:hypothetical protein
VATSIECVRLLLRGELDVVHAHNLPDFLVLAGLLPRLAGRKVVLDIHDSMPETFATKFHDGAFAAKLIRLQEKLSSLVAHRVICVNDPQRETLVGRGIAASKTFVSMNVPDPKIFGGQAAGRRPAGNGAHVDIVYHGTMVERLGVDLIIRAIAQVRERVPHVRLHLWGNGDDFPRFHRLAEDLGLGETVLFNRKGFPVQELPKHLRSMDLGVVGNRRSVATDLMLPVKLMDTCLSVYRPSCHGCGRSSIIFRRTWWHFTSRRTSTRWRRPSSGCVAGRNCAPRRWSGRRIFSASMDGSGAAPSWSRSIEHW